MFSILGSIWFVRTTKIVLFYIYLWQLKEYHIGRFVDHFRTTNGKKLFFNLVFGIKLILLLSYLIFPLLVLFILLVVYLLEGLKFILDIVRRKVKKPVLTKKTNLLILAGIFIEGLIIFGVYNYTESLSFVAFMFLVFDILIPLIISIMVLLFQPLAVFGRNRIINMAKKKRGEFSNLLVIGVTGSYGKTSIKEFLATILSKKFKVLKTDKHQNSEIGIARCVLNNLNKEHEIFICEMGAYNVGGVKFLCDIVKPKIGVLAGINQQHMATFGSQENIIKAKFELIDSLPVDGTAVLNWGNDLIAENHSRNIETLKYDLNEKKNIWADNIQIDKYSIKFKAFSNDGDSADFKLNLIGGHNIINILGAVAVAKKLGMKLEEISKICEEINPSQSGIELKNGINGLNIIDATYSANPNGVVSHLEYLKLWSGKKVIIMPCLIELGKSSKEIHQKLGEEIGEVCDLAIITTKERFGEIKKGFSGAVFIEDPKKILEKIKKFCTEEDVVLLESRVQKYLISKLIK